MRINILDPGLVHVGGHHLDSDAGIASVLLGQGHSVHIFSNLTVEAGVAERIPDGVKYTRVFRYNPYEFGPPPAVPVARQFVLYRRAAKSIAEDLKKVSPADAWIWPSLFVHDLRACALVNPGVPISGVIHFGLDARGRSLTADLAWRDAVRLAIRQGLEIRRIGTIEEELLPQLMPSLGRLGLASLAVPLEASAAVIRKTELRTVGFFGHQRRNKGVERLDALAEACLGMGLQVIVHDSNRILEEQEVSPGLRHVGYVDDLAALIAESDVVVLPYALDHYRTGCSGIGSLGIASGVPVLAPVGTAIAKVLGRYDTGLVYADPSLDGILAAIAAMRADYPSYAAKAFEAAQRWPRSNGVARHTAELMGQYGTPDRRVFSRGSRAE